MNRLMAHTRIRVTIEVPGSSYGPEWQLGDIAKQAGEEAVSGLRQRIGARGFTLIGEPEVTTVMVIPTKDQP